MFSLFVSLLCLAGYTESSISSFVSFFIPRDKFLSKLEWESSVCH